MRTNLPTFARQLANPAPVVPDGEYLRRYAETRDEEAFADLVRRNGPLVLRACRSVLLDPAAADDAFQATFIQLARHAAQLTSSRSLAGWLHTAAIRAAGAVRRAETRRHRREQLVRPVQNTQPPEDLTWLEVRSAINAELARMPETYRLPLLLCYIEGLSYTDAATRLCCSLGALRGRLERGRQLLRRRLERRGLPAVALTLGIGAPPAVSAGLRQLTLAAVRTAGSTRGLMSGWRALTQPHRVLIAGCVVAVVVAGVGLGAFRDSADPPVTPLLTVPAAQPSVTAEASGPRLDTFGDPLPPGAVARLGTRRFVEKGRDFALSPDGKMIAVSDSNLTLLDSVTGQVLRHQKWVWVGYGLFWRPDGRGVALIGRYPREKYLWDFTDPKDVPPTSEPLPHDTPPPQPPEGTISCAAVSPDGRWLAIGMQSPDPARLLVQVYPCETGKRLRDLKPDRTLGPFPAACERVWFAAGGRELVLARADHTVIAVDAANGKELRRATLPRWSVIASSPDGKFVAIIPRSAKRDIWHSGDETVRVWDLTARKEVWSFPRPGLMISGLVFTPDGKHLITSDAEYQFRRWDLASGKEAGIRQAWDGLSWMSTVALSADGKRYATTRDPIPIKVWDAATGTQLNPLPAHWDSIAGVAVSPDSRLAATVGYDGTMRVWGVDSGKLVCTAPAARADPKSIDYGLRRGVSFTPDSRAVVFDAAGVLTMANATTGKPVALPGGLKGHSGTVGGFSADGKTLVTFSGDSTTLWDWPAGSARRAFLVSLEKQRPWGPPPKTPRVAVVWDATLSTDGETLVTVSAQQPVPDDGWGGPNSNDIWDVKTGIRRFRFGPDLWYPRTAFSPDGRTLYAGGHASDPEAKHNRVRRDGLASWDVAAGSIIRRFDDPSYDPVLGPNDPRQHAGRQVQALALSPDGRLLAVADGLYSNSVWIHETASGRVVREFVGHNNFIYNMAFTPDGSKLVSVSRDHTGLVWDITLPTFTDRKPGPLTPKELADNWGRLAAPDAALGGRSRSWPGRRPRRSRS
ncbi:MAG: hypothetical protein JWO38_1035 [Gemmataceae bacterium]|nr:hypothetical protein [Gemmataceae bacterium]